MLMSTICAPPSTWSRATSSASAYSSFLISLKNFLEPVTLVRSPTLTNKLSRVMLKASSPDRWQAGLYSGMARGACGETISTMVRICSGVVPQQPPTILTIPALAKPCTIVAVSVGVSSYSPNSFGKPALGCADTKVSQTSDKLWICGLRASAPKAQLKPIEMGLAWRTEL